MRRSLPDALVRTASALGGEPRRVDRRTGAKVAVVAVPMFAGQHYMMNAEIAPRRQQVENVEAGLGGLEGRFERFSEAMADFRVEALT